jgi:hypothetical protein
LAENYSRPWGGVNASGGSAADHARRNTILLTDKKCLATANLRVVMKLRYGEY